MHLTVGPAEAHRRLTAAGCVLVGEVVPGTESWLLPNGMEIIINYEHTGDYPEQMVVEAEQAAAAA